MDGAMAVDKVVHTVEVMVVQPVEATEAHRVVMAEEATEALEDQVIRDHRVMEVVAVEDTPQVVRLPVQVQVQVPVPVVVVVVVEEVDTVVRESIRATGTKDRTGDTPDMVNRHRSEVPEVTTYTHQRII